MIKDVRARITVAAAAVFLGAATMSLDLAATGGNDYYQVAVENAPAGVGVGVYTVTTGILHPIAGSLGTQDVLFGRGIPGSSFTTIRSYTSGTDYVQRNGLTLAAGAPPTLVLEDFVAAGEEAIPVGDPLNPAGFTTIYRPGGLAAAPDDLVIRQTIEAVGGSFDDAAAVLRTEITNGGGAPVLVGVRYLWDFQIGANDDGPSFRPKGPDGSPLSTETAYLSPAFSGFEVTDDNDQGACFGIGNLPFPYYAVQGSVTGPAVLRPAPPTRLAYLSWPAAAGLNGKYGWTIPAPNAFDYQASGADISTCLISMDDTGAAYWWGDAAANALSIAPGATASVQAFLFAYLPGMPPAFTPAGVEGPPGDPTCTDGTDNDGDGLVDADDPDCAPPAPQVEGPFGDPTCSDGADNDGDALVDADDPDCAPPAPQVEGPFGDPTCSDGADNDGDGLVDADDPDCAPPAPQVEGPFGDPTCADGADNDGDGLVDADDPDCAPPAPPVEGPPGDPSCSDDLDNDGDGLRDIHDPDCAAPNSLPACGAAAPSPGTLWPPNHRFKTVEIGGVTDADGDPLTITVTSIKQDEPVTALGEGGTCPDASGEGGTVSLRAERSGAGDGRVYHIAFTADDGAGGRCTGEVTVCVPHDRRWGRTCVDQGPLFDSTGPCAGRRARR